MENKYKKKTDRLAYWCQFVQLFRQKILDATPVSLYEDVSTLVFTLVRGESWGGKKEKKKKEKNILEILEISRAQERGVWVLSF